MLLHHTEVTRFSFYQPKSDVTVFEVTHCEVTLPYSILLSINKKLLLYLA